MLKRLAAFQRTFKQGASLTAVRTRSSSGPPVSTWSSRQLSTGIPRTWPMPSIAQRTPRYPCRTAHPYFAAHVGTHRLLRGLSVGSRRRRRGPAQAAELQPRKDGGMTRDRMFTGRSQLDGVTGRPRIAVEVVVPQRGVNVTMPAERRRGQRRDLPARHLIQRPHARRCRRFLVRGRQLTPLPPRASCRAIWQGSAPDDCTSRCSLDCGCQRTDARPWSCLRPSSVPGKPRGTPACKVSAPWR
jgi:hypothetical protein